MLQSGDQDDLARQPPGGGTLVTITDSGLALLSRVLPGHVQVVRRLLFDPLTGNDVCFLRDILVRVRDHMRAQPPRSAAPRKRRSASGA